MPNRIASPSTRLIAAFLAWIAVAAAAAQNPSDFTDDTALPESPLGMRIKEVIAALDADEGGLKNWVQSAMADSFMAEHPLDEHLAAFAAFRKRTQGVTFYAVRNYTPPRPRTVAIVRDKLSGGWHGIILSVAKDPPHKIEGLGFSPARPPKELPAAGGPLSQADALREFDATVKKLAQADVFSGAVLLARQGQALYRAAFGEANKSCGAANQPDTKFNLGSMNKMFTAVSIAQLAEAGKLRYDDPAGKYLDGAWLPSSTLEKFQIRHLLTHTSGLGDYFNDDYMKSSRDRFRNLEDFQELINGSKLEFEPGARHRYSNTGYLLLGAVVEKASGLAYDDYVRQHIFEKAGMPNTAAYEVDAVVPNLALGYSPAPGGGWRSNILQHVAKGGPAGGGYSTVDDLWAFSQALQGGKLVSAKTLDLMTSPKDDVHSPEYGYGFGLASQSPLGRKFGHGGGFPGISSLLDIHPDSGWTIIILSNYDGGSQPVHAKALELLGRVTESKPAPTPAAR